MGEEYRGEADLWEPPAFPARSDYPPGTDWKSLGPNQIKIVCHHHGTPSAEAHPSNVAVLVRDYYDGWDPFGGGKEISWILSDAGKSNLTSFTVSRFSDDIQDATLTLTCDRCKQNVSWRHVRQRARLGAAFDAWAKAGQDTMTLKGLRSLAEG